MDGSLSLRIIDDENTSKYFPQDKFYVFHNSEISGVDFVETYLYSESNQTFASGSKAEASPGVGRLILSPNDGNGANPISAPVSTFEREWNQAALSWEYLFKERPIQLRAIAYDENGTNVSTASVQWSVHLDFNSSEEIIPESYNWKTKMEQEGWMRRFAGKCILIFFAQKGTG